MISEDIGRRSATARSGDLLVWLGGGTWRDIEEPGERAGYQAAGLVVGLVALVAWGVSAGAVVSVGALGAVGAAAATLVVGLLAGALGRLLVAAPGQRAALIGPGAAAALTGVVLGELAALILFGGSLAPHLDARVGRAAAVAVGTGEEARRLADLRAERAGLDRRVDQAAARRDEALLVARCEYRPAAGCPPQLITGDPGRGPEAEQARAALARADADLDVARADRTRRVTALNQDIAAAAARVEQDRGSAARLAREDGGLVAQWDAMNDYTGVHPSAWLPRLAAIAVLVLLLVAPLLLRLWRGTTDQDRLVEARRRRRHAERDADTAIAVRRAEIRAERELGLLDAGLPGPAAVTATVVPDGRTALAAAGTAADGSAGDGSAGDGSAGDGSAGYGSEDDGSAGYGSAEDGTADDGTGTAPAPVPRADLLARLPGPLPVIGRTVGGIAGAIVPAPVARMAAGRPRPLRMVRTIWDEVEEFQFSVLRRRRVTVTEEHLEEHLEEPVDDRLERVPATAEYRTHAAGQLAAGGPASLERGRRELPAADDSG